MSMMVLRVDTGYITGHIIGNVNLEKSVQKLKLKFTIIRKIVTFNSLIRHSDKPNHCLCLLRKSQLDGKSRSKSLKNTNHSLLLFYYSLP